MHDPPTYSSLRSPLKLTRHMPLVFGHPSVTSRSHGSSHEAVPRDNFERQFHAFTSGVFADWEPSLWSNVLVAGAHRLPHLLSTFGRHLCLAYSLQLFRTRSTPASPGCLSYSSDPHGRWGCAGEFTACRP